MKISLLEMIGQFGGILQDHLFPAVSEELGALSSKQEQLIRTLALLGLEGFTVSRRGLVGRPGHDRACVARAFVAKAVYNFVFTRALIDRLLNDVVLRRLCGWETAEQVPDESLFSRVFAEFATSEFPQRVHEALIEKTQKDRLIGHISRDATAIDAREKATPKPEPAEKVKRPRRKRDEPKRPDQMKRMERQASMSLPEMMADLPRCCDVGRKSNSKGNAQVWIGYKLHLDVADGQIPISCILTSASLHDSQVALPLATLTAQRVTSLYDQGQICLNTRRIIIQRKIYDEFLRKFAARTSSLPACDPLNPKTIIGPIITPDALKMIETRVKEALARGGKAHTGAKHEGQIYCPTILTDVPLDAAIANEETFGPVVVVEAVDTPDEAIAAANRTMYGLTSSIFSGNPYKAFEMAPKVLAGIVNVNSPTVNDEIHAPMGGVRDSDWGRTGPRSLDDFSDVIWINSHSGQRQYPF